MTWLYCHTDRKLPIFQLYFTIVELLQVWSQTNSQCPILPRFYNCKLRLQRHTTGNFIRHCNSRVVNYDRRVFNKIRHRNTLLNVVVQGRIGKSTFKMADHGVVAVVTMESLVENTFNSWAEEEQLFLLINIRVFRVNNLNKLGGYKSSFNQSRCFVSCIYI